MSHVVREIPGFISPINGVTFHQHGDLVISEHIKHKELVEQFTSVTGYRLAADDEVPEELRVIEKETKAQREAREKAEKEAAEKAEQERLAAEKEAAEKEAAEKAAAEKAEQERLAAEQAEAAKKAEADKKGSKSTKKADQDKASSSKDDDSEVF